VEDTTWKKDVDRRIILIYILKTEVIENLTGFSWLCIRFSVELL
jgi:hypothetical protein